MISTFRATRPFKAVSCFFFFGLANILIVYLFSSSFCALYHFTRWYLQRKFAKVFFSSISGLLGNLVDVFLLIQDSGTCVYSLPRIRKSHTFRLDPGSSILWVIFYVKWMSSIWLTSIIFRCWCELFIVYCTTLIRSHYCFLAGLFSRRLPHEPRGPRLSVRRFGFQRQRRIYVRFEYLAPSLQEC